MDHILPCGVSIPAAAHDTAASARPDKITP
jgi:hypothetical protein